MISTWISFGANQQNPTSTASPTRADSPSLCCIIHGYEGIWSRNRTPMIFHNLLVEPVTNPQSDLKFGNACAQACNYSALRSPQNPQ
jgi:hypothetical protein